MVPETEAQQAPEMFRVLGDMTRFKILYALSKWELCVCEIAEVVQMAQSGCISSTSFIPGCTPGKIQKRGNNGIFSLNDVNISALLQYGIDHIRQK